MCALFPTHFELFLHANFDLSFFMQVSFSKSTSPNRCNDVFVIIRFPNKIIVLFCSAYQIYVQFISVNRTIDLHAVRLLHKAETKIAFIHCTCCYQYFPLCPHHITLNFSAIFAFVLKLLATSRIFTIRILRNR